MYQWSVDHRPLVYHVFLFYYNSKVLQKRQDGSINFDLEWQDYRKGFGHIGGEYWLGNENTYIITNQNEYELRVEAEEFDGTKHISTYDHFRLGSEDDHYTLYTGTYTGKQGAKM